MTHSTFLPGAAIDLVPITPRDAATTHHWFNDQEVAQYLGRYGHPMIEAQSAQYYETAAGSGAQLILGIRTKEPSALIGTIGLHDINHRDQTAELGIVIGAKDTQGKGYGREAITLLAHHAFTRLNLRNLTLRVLGNNERALRCYRKVGFVETGRLKGHVFREGVWVDDITMRLMKDRLYLTEAEATRLRIKHIVEQSR